MRPHPDPQVAAWLDDTNPDLLFASVITFGEIRLGIEKLPAGKRRAELESWLRVGVLPWFDKNLLPVTRSIADRWGKLTADGRRRGFTLSAGDGLIAATALEHDLTLVTRNVKDFQGLGVAIFNPWEDQP